MASSTTATRRDTNPWIAQALFGAGLAVVMLYVTGLASATWLLGSLTDRAMATIGVSVLAGGAAFLAVRLERVALVGGVITLVLVILAMATGVGSALVQPSSWMDVPSIFTHAVGSALAPMVGAVLVGASVTTLWVKRRS